MTDEKHPSRPAYSAAELVQIMAGMREHGIARLQVAELRLELGAQLPSAALANAMRLARPGGHAEPAPPAVTGPVQIEPVAEPAAAPPASENAEPEEDEDFPTDGPPMGARIDRKTLAGLSEKDPLLAGTLPPEEMG